MITECDVGEITLVKHKGHEFSFKLGLKLSSMLKVSKNNVFRYRTKSLLNDFNQMQRRQRTHKTFQTALLFSQQIFARTVNLSISKSVRYSVFQRFRGEETTFVYFLPYTIQQLQQGIVMVFGNCRKFYVHIFL